MASKKQNYWAEFLENSADHSHLWLEGFYLPAIPTPDYTFASEKLTFKKNTLQSLKKFQQQKKLSFGTLLQAAWGLLLNRYSTQDHILYCMGTLSKLSLTSIIPVKSSVSEKDSLLSYLMDLEKQLNESKKREKSFNINLLSDRSHLSYLMAFKGKKKSHSNELPLDPKESGLILIAQENKHSQIELLYSKAKFTKESAKNLLRHYFIILEKIITDYDQLVTHFSILTPDEKKKLLIEWNCPKLPLPPKKLICIHDQFSKQAGRLPEKTAVTDSHTTLSYQKLDRLSNQLSHDLLKKGAKSGDNIAVLTERSPFMIAIMLAIFKIGAVYVPINPKYPDERIDFILEDCDATIILTNTLEKVSRRFIERCFIVDSTYKPSQNSEKIATRVTPEQVAYIIYTSGTTGQPKGVMIKHLGLINLAAWYQTHFKVDENDRASQFASQGFDSFFCETIPFLTAGASIHIVDDPTKLSPTLFLPWLSQQKITICDLPTAYSLMLFSLPWPEDLSLRQLKIGGESLTRYPTHSFSFDIWNGYGPTETTVEATFIKVYQANTPIKKQPSQYIPPPIGKPICNVEVYVVDTRLQPIPIGVAGELLIGGLGLSPGYVNRPQLTREKFIRNIFSDDPNAKLYRTGDLVRWLPDGNLEFMGRIDQQVKISGYRIELSEINTLLNQYPDVNEVVVLTREVGNLQKTLVAYVVPNLDKIRIPFQERCLIAVDEINFLELLTEDFSKEGIAVSGLTESFKINQHLRVNLKLPGMGDWHWFTGRLAWQQGQRAGIEFDDAQGQKNKLNNSINFYLATNNLIQTLNSAAAKRSLRKALKKKLPDYMIPTTFTVLPEFPLTLNGKVDTKSLPPPQDFERLLERNYVAPRTETEKALVTIWSELLDQHQISITDNFFDLGGNSLLVSQLSIRLLEQFNISVPAKILFDLPFIPILGEYIDSNGKKYTFISSIQDEINHDAILSETLEPCKKLSPHLIHPQGILLTGAGGFLGIYLLRELLKTTDSKIYCLIRKGEFETPAKRLISTLERFQLSHEIALTDRRIIIIDSDIGRDKFGISAAQYDGLAEKVDIIYHCGAQVNTMASYTNLRNSNVLGTLEVIKFATHKVDKAIHYISTLSTAYKLNAEGEYSEEFPDANVDQLTGGYAISKWVSERLLTQIKNRGLPVNIFRSGYILGQSDTGIMNLNDALLLLIKGCIQLGYAPNWNEVIAILPVDFVSHAVVGITLSTGSKSNVYHIDHPHGILWIDLVNWLNNYGYKIKLCSHKEWQKKLTKIKPDNALYHFLPGYLSMEGEPNTPRTNMIHAKDALKNIKIHYPEISDELLHRYMHYLCEIQFMPNPERTSASRQFPA